MNHFEFIINNDDLGVSILENIFINHYMPMAPGDYVKVYLLGLKYCRNSNLTSLSNKIIAKTLNILESDVSKAWQYWQKQGIISFVKNGEDDFTIRYYHISSLMLEGHAPKTEHKNLEDMYKAIEYMYGRPLSSKELNTIFSWVEEFNFVPEMIMLLVEYCIDLDKKDFNYLNKVALNWYDNKITTYQEAMQFLEDYRQKNEGYYKIMNYLGFRRSPTKAELATMDKWMKEYNMSLDLIFEACNKTLAIDKPNFKYIDKVLSDWHNKKYTTVEDVKNEKAAPPKQKSIKKPAQSDYDYNLLEKKLEEKMWREINER